MGIWRACRSGSVADVDVAFHNAACSTVQSTAEYGMSSVGVVLQLSIGIHNAPRVADADVGDVVIGNFPLAANDLIDNGTGGVGGSHRANCAGAHVSVDHLHVHTEEAAHNVNVFRLDLFSAACHIVNGLGGEGQLR